MKYFILYIIILLKMPFVFAQTDKKLLYEGNRKYEKKDYSAAEKKYREAQIKQKSGVESYFNLGDALYSQGKYDSANQQFNKVLQQSKDNKTKSAAYHNLGNSMLKNNKLDESISAYKNALRYNPGDASAQYNLSYALQKKKQNQQQQNQQNKDKNNDQQNNQDQNEPQDKKDNPDKNKQPENNQNQPQQDKNGMSKEEAERILNGLNNKEQNLRKRMYDKGDKQGQPYEPKPW
jgi:tetratricopeptide (TPR) repeat protein